MLDLESILKEVHSVDGSEQILLEALNFLALNIYFNTENEDLGGLGSPLTGRRTSRLQPQKIGSEDMLGGFDRD